MIEYLTLEQILELHASLIDKFGGLSGIRDNNLLMSVIEMPKTTIFGDDLYSTIYDKAACYLFQLVRNHPFNDANKRTGASAAYLFLKANNIEILFDDASYEDLIVEVAKGNKSKEEIAHFLEYGEETSEKLN